MKVLFFIPHPDDLEFGVSLICIEALKAGMDVVQVLMTNGEYGTKVREFKGKRLRRIRAYELNKTVKVYQKFTGNKMSILKMNYIDGHLPLNQESLDKTIDIFKKEMPDIIFAPDPFFPIDYHPDHLNTGRLPCFALKKLERKLLPKRVFLFYSFRTNIAIRCRIKSLKILNKAMSQHRSQVPPFTIKQYIMYKKLALSLGYLKNNGFASRVREIKITKNGVDFNNRITKRVDFLKYYFYSKITDFGPKPDQYTPTPKELDLM